MDVFFSGTKGNLDRRRCLQPTKLLLDVIKEAFLTFHITKPGTENIIESFRDVYHEYWANQKGELMMPPAMDAAGLTLNILSYAQHLATIIKTVQKTSNKNAWSLTTAQADLKARMEGVAHLKEQLINKTTNSKETLPPQLEQALQEAKLAKNQLTRWKPKYKTSDDPAKS